MNGGLGAAAPLPLSITPGSPEPLGVRCTASGQAGGDIAGVNIAVHAPAATRVEFCLFDEAGEQELARLPLPGRLGDVWHGRVQGIGPGARYGLRVAGPQGGGHRCNPQKLLLDPFAGVIDRPFALHPAQFDFPPTTDGGVDFNALPDSTDSAPFMPKAVVEEAEDLPALLAGLMPARRPTAPVIYELHVRGFTMQHPEIPEALRGTFAGLAHPAVIGHLRRLGVTAVEIMPCAAWVDERHLPPLGLRNYWGYNPVLFGAPDPRLAPGGFPEIRAAVAALQQAGIAVLLDVVLNHSGESDHLGPTLSLRGLDQPGCYRLRGDDPRLLVDDAGCGNVLALDRPFPLRLALDCLRRWVLRTGIDGFRFDLATTLARRPEGFDPAAPFLAALAQDPVLRDRWLVAEPWDIGPGGYQLGHFPPGWGEWNDRFRDDLRRFWRGDDGMLGPLATRLAGSADVFGPRRGADASINYITAHDGFTLADLVSYAGRHNEANGEQNRDGTGENYSWNHGHEGLSADAAIQAARAADQRALLASLLLARGTPMLAMGDEIGRSQQGNNNAYCQDNALSWVDWARADAGLLDFTTRLIAARCRNPALSDTAPLRGVVVDSSGLPDVEWRRLDGAPMQEADWHGGRSLACTLYHAASGNRVMICVHAGAEAARLVLPEARPGQHWVLAADSAFPTHRGPAAALAETEEMQTLLAGPRSVLLVVEEADPDAVLPTDLAAPAVQRRQGVVAAPAALLGRLAEAAGIAPFWYDVAGHRTEVPAETQRALLRALRLPAETALQARASLGHLAETRDLAPLPPVLVVREGEAPSFRLGPSALAARWATLWREDGSTAHYPLARATAEEIVACDDRRAEGRRVVLPPQPLGRHVLRLEDGVAGEALCHLAVVPAQCFLPPALGQRRFGIAAHLYTLRSGDAGLNGTGLIDAGMSDAGIGDFATLAALCRVAGGSGAAVVGLNPLHMMFPQDRARCSPYSPSDRRYLDPIYLAVAGGDAAERQRLSHLSAVDYAGVWAFKRPLLEQAFADFEQRGQQAGSALADGAEAQAFAEFVAAGGAPLQRFATYQALVQATGHSAWREWPAAWRSPDASGIAGFAAEHAQSIRFACWLQWQADLQLGEAARAAQAAGLPLGLYRDLAVGTAPEGAEAWGEQEGLMQGVSVGAPPDPLGPEGQIWNLPPPDPLAWARSGYASFAGLVRANMRHAGALRIDHVLGLRRLFLVPEGASGAEGAYLAYPFQDLIGQLALESQRAGCLVVGEDLGTVPEGTGEALQAAGILSYKLLFFQRDGAGAFLPPADWPVRASACVSTHDLPTLAGWWEGADIAERQGLGLIPPEAVPAQYHQRAAERRQLLEALAAHAASRTPPVGADALTETMPAIPEVEAAEGPLTPAIAAAVHAYVAATPSLLALVQAEDLVGEKVGVNLPGTDQERPNWRRRLQRPVEAMLGTPLAEAVLAAMRGMRD